jgi:hypothetical protein
MFIERRPSHHRDRALLRLQAGFRRLSRDVTQAQDRDALTVVISIVCEHVACAY